MGFSSKTCGSNSCMMAIPPWFMRGDALRYEFTAAHRQRAPACCQPGKGGPLRVPTLLNRRGLVKEGIVWRRGRAGRRELARRRWCTEVRFSEGHGKSQVRAKLKSKARATEPAGRGHYQRRRGAVRRGRGGG